MCVKEQALKSSDAATAPAEEEKCHAIRVIESGIGIAREQGITDPKATIYVVLGHMRSRYPHVTAVLRRLAESQ